MTGNSVNGNANGERSGAQTLLLLAQPPNVLLLKALATGAKSQAELQQATGSPAQTTLRSHLKRLVEIGAAERRRRDRFPGTLDFELTASGQALLPVAGTLERWVESSPTERLELGSTAAKAAVKALAEGWSTTMLRAFGVGPLSLTELDRVIGSLSYPSLERRLSAMRRASLVEARAGRGRGTPYAANEWLRLGVAPLAVAARWERKYLPSGAAPIRGLDIEAVFLLMLPLLRLPSELSGECRLAAEIARAEGSRLAGVQVDLDRGTQVSRSTRLRGHPDSWALGSPSAWLAAVLDGDRRGLEFGGDCRLAQEVVDGLHGLLASRVCNLALDAGSSIGDDGSN